MKFLEVAVNVKSKARSSKEYWHFYVVVFEYAYKANQIQAL